MRWFAKIKMMIPRFITLLVLMLSNEAVLAGGSWEPVTIASIKTLSDVGYVLRIDLVPSKPNETRSQDPMFQGCSQLEIHGTFRSLHRKGQYAWIEDMLFPPKQHDALTKKMHIEAIAYLKEAATDHKTINFGYMGTGFVPINKKHPCIVASRTLELLRDGKSTAVISYFYEL